jgi:uncharacterized protein YcbK (DUF882 family)
MPNNFSIAELLHSNTAIADGYTEQFQPPVNIISNLQALIDNVLQPLRDKLGIPIYVNCGYRCPRVNAKVGGVANSQHLTGEAADIHTDDNKALFEAIKNSDLPFDQLIEEGNGQFLWVHVSHSAIGLQRKQVLYL